jgi:hypothetical protein
MRIQAGTRVVLIVGEYSCDEASSRGSKARRFKRGEAASAQEWRLDPLSIIVRCRLQAKPLHNLRWTNPKSQRKRTTAEQPVRRPAAVLHRTVPGASISHSPGSGPELLCDPI